MEKFLESSIRWKSLNRVYEYLRFFMRNLLKIWANKRNENPFSIKYSMLVQPRLQECREHKYLNVQANLPNPSLSFTGKSFHKSSSHIKHLNFFFPTLNLNHSLIHRSKQSCCPQRAANSSQWRTRIPNHPTTSCTNPKQLHVLVLRSRRSREPRRFATRHSRIESAGS